jgi:hypothetical protein
MWILAVFIGVGLVFFVLLSFVALLIDEDEVDKDGKRLVK